MKLVEGDILKFKGAKTYAAAKGAKAIFKGYKKGHNGEEYVNVEWIRDGFSGNQEDGGYHEHMFEKVEEVSFEKENRIFEYKEFKKEKVMKIEFKVGVQRVIDMLVDFSEGFEADMLQDIKIILNREEEDAVNQIEDIIESIRIHQRETEKAIERLEKVDSLKDVLLAMRNTVFEEDEATVLKAFFGVDSVTID